MRVTYILSLSKDADSQQREILDRKGPKERPFQLETPALNEAKYLDQEKLAFVYDYLEKAEDARSMTTETSDSGMLAAQSEVAPEEASGKFNPPIPFPPHSIKLGFLFCPIRAISY